jgi:hypothetical protein
MKAVYGEETSNLKIRNIIGQFLRKNVKELMKRVLYTYFLRDFSLASAQLLSGMLLFGFGTIYGAWGWYESIATGSPASTGTVMLATLPIILGFQLLLSFFGFDMANEPKVPLQAGMPGFDRRVGRAEAP